MGAISVSGQLEHPAIAESSGLAASVRYPGVFWTHNDTESPAFLFAINAQGAHLGAYEVQGGDLIDWEATALDEVGNLYLADIGTNGLVRTHSAVHRSVEPDISNRWGPVEINRSWFVRFPGVREDCESFFVWQGFGYLLAKYRRNDRVPLYRFRLDDTAASILLELVADVPVGGEVSEATLSADGTQLALVTNNGIEMLFLDGRPETAATAPRRTFRFENPFMEGGAFLDTGLLVTQEASRDVLLFSDPVLFGAPILLEPLDDIISFTGRTIEWGVEVSVFPTPSYAWSFNGQPLAGATNALLRLADLKQEQTGVYEVTASNRWGTVRSRASLTVGERVPDLRITEVMSSTGPNTLITEDWWELTSFDAEPVDLSGWRFNDSTGGIFDAFTFPAGITIRPGESVVFVENMSATAFRRWWWETQVPAGVQVITYSGSTLSFRAAGDTLRVWTRTAVQDAATFARVDFGAAASGISFGYDPVGGTFGQPSVLGKHGAFRAATGSDIGSPGRIRSIEPIVIQIARNSASAGVRVTFEASASLRYVLEVRDRLGEGNWSSTGQSVQLQPTGSAEFERPATGGGEFFRIRIE